eukprot:gene3193-3471_t
MDSQVSRSHEQCAEEQPMGAAATVSSKAATLTSQFTGVCWNKKNRRWQASINSGGKYLYLGSFVSEQDAARTFDMAAIKLRGQNTKTNFPLEHYLNNAGQLLEDPELDQIIVMHEQLVLTQKMATAQALALAGVQKKPRGGGAVARRGTKASKFSSGFISQAAAGWEATGEQATALSMLGPQVVVPPECVVTDAAQGCLSGGTMQVQASPKGSSPSGNAMQSATSPLASHLMTALVNVMKAGQLAHRGFQQQQQQHIMHLAHLGSMEDEVMKQQAVIFLAELAKNVPEDAELQLLLPSVNDVTGVIFQNQALTAAAAGSAKGSQQPEAGNQQAQHSLGYMQKILGNVADGPSGSMAVAGTASTAAPPLMEGAEGPEAQQQQPDGAGGSAAMTNTARILGTAPEFPPQLAAATSSTLKRTASGRLKAQQPNTSAPVLTGQTSCVPP